MIIQASKDFTNRFKCRLSLAKSTLRPAPSPDAWSAHLFRLGSSPFALVTHEMTLWSFIIAAKGITTAEGFLKEFLPRVAEAWKARHAEFDASNQSIVFVRRSNRSVIGTMNDFIWLIRVNAEAAFEEGKPWNLPEMEESLRRTPCGALGYDRPVDKISALLGPA